MMLDQKKYWAGEKHAQIVDKKKIKTQYNDKMVIEYFCLPPLSNSKHC